MKKQISMALLGLVLTLAAGAAAFAQTPHALVIQLPFDFVAGEKRMPAGRYAVSRVSVNAESALLIRSEDGHGAAVVLTSTGKAPASRAALSFRQYGGRYFLAEVSVPGMASVREVRKTGGEKRVEREFVAEAEDGGAVRKVTVVGSVQ